MRPTPLYRAYSVVTRVALPVAGWLERRKVLAAGMGADRAAEKLGHASLPRPAGRLIWFHAASVGESLSVLSLIRRMGQVLPDAEFLITSGTPTSAELVARRMPPHSRHQFAPLDAPGPVSRFLAHWTPQAAILVESELWPQMLMRTDEAGVPLALVNARMSPRSVAGWRKRPKTARMILQVFRLILTQTEELARTIVELGADPGRVRQGANLKALSEPLPADAAIVAAMTDRLAGRPVWVAASTHPGEEVVVLDAHARLLADHPDLCLILAPRHPARGDEVAGLIAARGWPAPRRSAGALPEGPVYLADTLGELGSWYALAPFVFLGGSLEPVGGHNPYEVAQAGAAVLSGPHVFNFTDTFAAMAQGGGARMIADAEDLARQADIWLSDPGACDAARGAARAFCDGRISQLDATAEELVDALDLRRA